LRFDSYRTSPQEAVVHVPDGFIDAPVSLGAGVAAAAAIGLALRGSRRELGDERVAPLAGLVAAFVFAVQMLNFPVAAGTSGHLLGGALAAVLVGPWTGLLCVSVVLLVQLFFADGGLTAYGVNVTCMAVTTALVGWLVFRALLRVLPRVPRSAVPASFGAALVSVPAAALVFTGIYAAGGTTDLPLGSLAAAMIGVHVLIGLGEAAITALVVSSVLAVRPDLVYGARALVAAHRTAALEVTR
jgi:cobalt/nickel transport system permease protein